MKKIVLLLLYLSFGGLIQMNAQQLKRVNINATLKIIPDSVMIGDSVTINLSFVNTIAETIILYPNSLISLNHRYIYEDLVFFTSDKPYISLYLNVGNPYMSILDVIRMSTFKNPVVLQPSDKYEMNYKIIVSEDFFYVDKINLLSLLIHAVPLQEIIENKNKAIRIRANYELWIGEK